MKNRIDMEEFSEFLNIPEFERIIYHKIEELKHVLADKIRIYKHLKNNFKKTAYGHLQIFENQETERKQTYRFELDFLQNNKWMITKIEPDLPEQCDINEIMPQAIIDHIVTYDTDPDQIFKYTGPGKTQVGMKNYEVEFTRYSDYHILGTIREGAIHRETSAEEMDMKIIKADWNYEQKGDEENFRELFHYMQKYPEIKKRIFGDFFHKAKPKVDNSAMNITLS
jgi:hypothetical protein